MTREEELLETIADLDKQISDKDDEISRLRDVLDDVYNVIRKFI